MKIGVPAAASIMNLVVISAVLSAVNATVFSNSRTFYNLALQGNAPAFLGVVNRHRVPARATMLVFALMFAGVLLNYLMPDQAFGLFSSITVFGLVCAWSSIVVAHMRFRRLRIRNGTDHEISYRMPFFPYGNYIALAFLVTVLVCIGILPDMRISLVVSATWVLVVFIAYKVFTREPRTVAAQPEDRLGAT